MQDSSKILFFSFHEPRKRVIATLKIGQKQAVLTCFCPRHMDAHGPFIFPGYAGAMEVGVHVYV